MSALLAVIAITASQPQAGPYDLRGIALGSSLDQFRVARPDLRCVTAADGRTSCGEAGRISGFDGLSMIGYKFTPDGILYQIDVQLDRRNIRAVTDSLTSRWGDPAGREGLDFLWRRGGQTIRYNMACAYDALCIWYEDDASARRMREAERERNRNAL